MTIETELVKLPRAVEELARYVGSLDAELFLQKMNGWSPRDIVAHLIGWNRYTIQGSEQIMSGEIPFYELDPGEDYSKVNAQLIRQYPARDRQGLLAELRTSTQELQNFLKTLEPGAWDHDFGVRYRGSVITIENTITELIADYDHHRKQIETWVEQSAAR